MWQFEEAQASYSNGNAYNDLDDREGDGRRFGYGYGDGDGTGGEWIAFGDGDGDGEGDGPFWGDRIEEDGY